MQEGKMITLEGIEGVGKSSNVRFVVNYLKDQGKPVLSTREPGGTPLAEALRHILLAEYEETTYPETELLLLYAGRFQHVEFVIKPALRSGTWVVCDRFNDATFAYQGAGRKIHFDKIQQLDQWVLGSFKPALTIILDAPVEVALARLYDAGRTFDRIEKENKTFFDDIRQGYLARAKDDPARCKIVDATSPLPLVQERLACLLEDFIKSA